ncbi:MAG TPA: hypothetical protein VGU64_06280, partial [Terriglobales bacterium]|nr:hypothetical protein [Terriglobales bacterium]
ETHTMFHKVRSHDFCVRRCARLWRILPRHGMGWSLNFYHRSFDGCLGHTSLEKPETLIEKEPVAIGWFFTSHLELARGIYA